MNAFQQTLKVFTHLVRFMHAGPQLLDCKQRLNNRALARNDDIRHDNTAVPRDEILRNGGDVSESRSLETRQAVEEFSPSNRN